MGKNTMLKTIPITKEQRDLILDSIKQFNEDEGFEIDDASKAIAYTWSVIARMEEQIATTNDNKLLGSLYTNLVRAAKNLVDQMLSHQKIKESKAKQEYISIATHAAILKALQDIFMLSLRKQGFTEFQIGELIDEMGRLQKEYPVAELSMEDLKERIYGEKPKEVTARLLPSPSSKFEELKELAKPISRKPR
jgi:hypothetical protein